MAEKQGKKSRLSVTRMSRKLASILFLLWLLLVNALYYAQFRLLAVSRLPWLAHLWR